MCLFVSLQLRQLCVKQGKQHVVQSAVSHVEEARVVFGVRAPNRTKVKFW